MIEYSGEKILCVCEGTFEKELIELLLEHDLLFFKTSDLVEDKVTTNRNIEKIKSIYLNRTYEDGLIILRVIDSENERFNLGKAYSNKVNNIIIANTKPEVEILVVIDKKLYQTYSNKFKSVKKPSDYCIQDLRIPNVKKSGFVKSHFNDIDKLVKVLKTYNTYNNKQKNYSIYNLLKN